MSDTSTQHDGSVDLDDSSGDSNPNFRQLRERAKTLQASNAELQAAKDALAREVSILKAGIDVESPLGDFFVKNYAGDATDVEALKTEATRLGVPFRGMAVPAEGSAAEVVEEPIEPTGTATRRALADGAPADTGEDADPRQVSVAVFNQQISAGQTEEDAQAASLRVLASAAMAGDPRVVYDPSKGPR